MVTPIVQISNLVPRKRFNSPEIALLVRFVTRKRFRWYKISVSYGVGVMPEQFNHFDRVAPGVRTRPLKCCAISGLSSDSWRWRRGGSAH